MPGSLRERQPNVWELRVFLGRDDNGKVRHGNQTFRGGKRAAERELTRLVAAAEDEPVPPPVVEAPRWSQSTTVNDAIQGWKDNGWEDLSPSTVRRYENMWMKHIHGSIGQQRLTSPQPVRRREVLSSFEGRRAGRGQRPSDPGPDASGLPTGSKVERRRAAQPDRRHRTANVGAG